jgi:hypothetical protein
LCKILIPNLDKPEPKSNEKHITLNKESCLTASAGKEKVRGLAILLQFVLCV